MRCVGVPLASNISFGRSRVDTVTVWPSVVVYWFPNGCPGAEYHVRPSSEKSWPLTIGESHATHGVVMLYTW